MKTGQMIRTWENAYLVSLGNINSYKRRLRELLTWSKPLCKKTNDKYGHWSEWVCKIQALKGLIEEQYPNTVFTLDNKTILKS